MKLDLIPMLQIQRDLYDIPRSWERFRQYLTVMIGDTDDLALPLPVMNPKSKEQVIATYDALIALDAEAIAMTALTEAQQRLSFLTSQFRVGLMVADDTQGGWTNRYFSEMSYRFETQALLQRNWIVPLFWTSEQPSWEKVRQEVLISVFRAAYIQHYSFAKTLQEMLKQEGFAMAFAGTQQPNLDPEKLTNAREVIRSYLDSTHFPTVFACLFGDDAAQMVGYPALGIPAQAGFAVALDEALQSEVTPEAFLLKTQSSV